MKNLLKLLYLAGILVALSSCEPGRGKLFGEWEVVGDSNTSSPQKLLVSHQHGLYWYHSETDSTRYHYSLQSDTLVLMNFRSVTTYRLLELAKRRMRWQRSSDGKVIQFKKVRGKKVAIPPAPKHAAPMKKNIQDLIFALTGPNVELRLKNLVEEFGEGDYIGNPTLYHLTGVQPERQEGELPDAESHRQLIREIQEIRKVGSEFRLKLRQEANFRTALPIYRYENGQRELQTVLDLFIRKDALIYLRPTASGIKVDIDGVRVGKGWLKIGLPTLRISGDYGSLLGFRFRLAR